MQRGLKVFMYDFKLCMKQVGDRKSHIDIVDKYYIPFLLFISYALWKVLFNNLHTIRSTHYEFICIL